MARRRLIAAFAGLVLTISGSNAFSQQPSAPQQVPAATLPHMALSSPGFRDGAVIPARYTHDVATPVSPELIWTDVPSGVVSFALIVTDIDSRNPQKSPSGVLHWLLFNIPGSTRSLPEAVPATQLLADGTVQGRNIRKWIGYLGPGAPASGPLHHYTFELFALDTILDLGPEASRADLLAAMNGHVVAKAATVGVFHLKGVQ